MIKDLSSHRVKFFLKNFLHASFTDVRLFSPCKEQTNFSNPAAQASGPVHMYTDIFENAYLFIRFGPPSTRPGGERGNGPPTGKFLGQSALDQFWGAEFENRWYTDNGRQPRFHNLKSRFGQKSYVHD